MGVRDESVVLAALLVESVNVPLKRQSIPCRNKSGYDGLIQMESAVDVQSVTGDET